MKWGSEATTDLAQIEAWWDEWPDANIGIVTGQDSGVVVIDLDCGPDPERPTMGGGQQCMIDLAQQIGQELPATVVALTPSGGSHLYFASPKDEEVKSSVGKTVYRTAAYLKNSSVKPTIRISAPNCSQALPYGHSSTRNRSMMR